MSLTGIGTAAFRHRVLRGREYVARPPEHVIADRDARLVADTRSDIEKWLGNPEPGRSALALSTNGGGPSGKPLKGSGQASAHVPCRALSRMRTPPRPPPTAVQSHGHASQSLRPSKQTAASFASCLLAARKLVVIAAWFTNHRASTGGG